MDEFGAQQILPDDKLRKLSVTYTDPQGTAHSGCRVAGEVTVSKIKGSLHELLLSVFEDSPHVLSKGNLHCAPGTVSNYAGQHIHNVNPFNMKTELENFKAEHEIHDFSFGASFPGMV